MLGTRTKQIFAYGKRQQRIVNVSDERDKSDPFSFLNTSTSVPKPPHAVAARMRKRENVHIAKTPKTPSPRMVKIQRKRRPKTLLATPPDQLEAKRHALLERVVAEEAMNRTPERTSSAAAHMVDHATPTRTPLIAFPMNIPGSVAMTSKKRKPKTSIEKRTPLSLKQPNPPFIEMDIIILDQHGQKISQERRVSCTDNRIPQKPNGVIRNLKIHETKRSVNGQTNVILSSDSEDEVLSIPQPKPPRRHHNAAKAVVLSDHSDSDLSVTEVELPAREPSLRPASISPQRLSHAHHPPCRVEVVIPPAPFSISKRYTTPDVLPMKQPEIEPIPHVSAHPPLDGHIHHPPVGESRNRPIRTSSRPPIGHQDHPSPVHRPRQLTPIRGASRGRSRQLFEPPSPPSPTIPSDFDLSFQLSNLHLDSLSLPHSGHEVYSPHASTNSPEYLLPLLSECAQETCGPHEFSAFIEMFPYDPIVRTARADRGDAQAFQKIGEASFSEVFGIGDVVLKIIPLRDETPAKEKRPTPTQAPSRSKADGRYGNLSWNTEKELTIKEGPPPSDTNDVLKEIIVTRAMGDMCEGFVRLLKAYVVRGKYPEVLLELWDDYFDRRGSESIRPGASKEMNLSSTMSS